VCQSTATGFFQSIIGGPSTFIFPASSDRIGRQVKHEPETGAAQSKEPRPFLSFVVPVYNEARRLAQTLEQITAYLARQSYTSEVVVVDDGSTDRSAEIAESFRATHPTVNLIRNDHRGKGFAVRTGMLHARGRIVLFSDADLATPVEATTWSLVPAPSAAAATSAGVSAGA
jgi:cellulose synthase/poly-beta-1,6-N-acetylglucosamine synthase-like glycosyltransferase